MTLQRVNVNVFTAHCSLCDGTVFHSTLFGRYTEVHRLAVPCVAASPRCNVTYGGDRRLAEVIQDTCICKAPWAITHL